MTVPGIGGRPLTFKSVEELEEKIQAYYDYCDSRTAIKIDKYGNRFEVPWPRPYTISGLALFIGCSRATLVNYSYKDEYFDAIMRARQKCEVFSEEQLFDGNDRGAKFNLINNHGWRDRQEVDLAADVDAQINVKFVPSTEDD